MQEKAKEAQSFFKKASAEVSELSRSPSVRPPQMTYTSIWKKADDELKHLGTFGLYDSLQGASSEISSKLLPNKEQEIAKRINKLEDPVHDSNMDALNTRMMLYDLISNDPVISGYHPTEVTAAFNHIKELAPKASQNRAFIQAQLRKYLSQGSAMDPFEVGNVMEQELNLGKTRALAESPVATRALGQKSKQEELS